MVAQEASRPIRTSTVVTKNEHDVLGQPDLLVVADLSESSLDEPPLTNLG